MKSHLKSFRPSKSNTKHKSVCKEIKALQTDFLIKLLNFMTHKSVIAECIHLGKSNGAKQLQGLVKKVIQHSVVMTV